jgi:hypothetical protein
MNYYKKLYTDYPFSFLGDINGEIAPIREIKVLSYDNNKYCEILVDGHKTEIKSGYIYTNKSRLDDNAINFDVNRHLMTNLEYSKHKRELIKNNKRKNIYTITVVSPSNDFNKDINHGFKTLKKALIFFKTSMKNDSYLILSGRANRKKLMYSQDTWLMELKDNKLTTFITNKKRNECFLKNKHIEKFS